jgi:hypothetical protein
MGRAVAMVVVRVIKAVFGAKKQAAADEDNGKSGQDCFDIHV